MGVNRIGKERRPPFLAFVIRVRRGGSNGSKGKKIHQLRFRSGRKSLDPFRFAYIQHQALGFKRKAEIVAAVDGGLISLDAARQRYSLSVEEFLSWQRAFDRFGQQGLRATKANDKRIAVRPRALARDNARVLHGN